MTRSRACGLQPRPDHAGDVVRRDVGVAELEDPDRLPRLQPLHGAGEGLRVLDRHLLGPDLGRERLQRGVVGQLTRVARLGRRRGRPEGRQHEKADRRVKRPVPVWEKAG